MQDPNKSPIIALAFTHTDRERERERERTGIQDLSLLELPFTTKKHLKFVNSNQKLAISSILACHQLTCSKSITKTAIRGGLRDVTADYNIKWPNYTCPIRLSHCLRFSIVWYDFLYIFGSYEPVLDTRLIFFFRPTLTGRAMKL